MKIRFGPLPWLPLAFSLFFSSPLRAAATPAQVLVVGNAGSPASAAIAALYAQTRGVPAANVFLLPAGTTTAETIDRATFNSQVRDPIAQYLSQSGLQNQVLYLVLCKGVPLRIGGPNIGKTNTPAASVDSELTLLFTGQLPDAGQNGWMANPYFLKEEPFDQFQGAAPRYLVCRLDGWDQPADPQTGVPIDVANLIQRSQNPAASGVFLLDGDPTKGGGFQAGENWLTNAADLLGQLGVHVVHDQTTTFLSNTNGLLGYAGWGSNDANDPGPPYYGEIPAGSGVVYPGSFAPGSLATTFVSTSARTFDTAKQSYGQSLIADLIHLGVTGANGHVYEPFLNGVVRPDVLYPRFVTGFDAAEAYYMAMPFLSWMNVVVCDPLMKSGVQSQFPPSIVSITPQTKDAQGGGPVLVVGKHLGGPGDAVTLKLGATVVSDAHFVLDDVVQGTIPAGEPGPVDVSVTVAAGTATAPAGFTYLPALTLGGGSALGDTAEVTALGHLGDSVLLFVGTQLLDTPLPPYGTFHLDPQGLLLASPPLPFPPFPPSLTLPFPIPNDPALHGLSFHFQAFVGDLDPATGTTRLTNVATLQIP